MDENKKFDCTEFYTYEYFERKFPKFPEQILQKLVDIQKERVAFIFSNEKNSGKQINEPVKEGKFIVEFD